MARLPFEITGSDGLPVRGDVDLPDGNRVVPVIVGAHGFKGFRRWGFWPRFAKAFAERGFGVVRYDGSHNGVGAEGLVFDEKHLFEKNTLVREQADLVAVLGALRNGALPGKERLHADRLALLGHSRGGALVIVHAADDPAVRAVVALAPIATGRRFPDEVVAQGLADGFVPIKNTRTGEILRFGREAILEMRDRDDVQDIAASHASRLTSPLLVVHGANDTSVPCNEGRKLAEAAPGGVYAQFEDCDHVLNCRHPWHGRTPAFDRFVETTADFLIPLLR